MYPPMSKPSPRSALVEEYRQQRPRSAALWEENRQGLLDGVGSAPRLVEPFPIAMDRAEGSRIWDVDGNEYVDLFNCFGGVALLGHAPEVLTEALKRQVDDGTVYGHPFRRQIEYVNELKDRYPYVEQLRLTNSGSEATMNAVRLARSYTGRDKLVKLEGTYHGTQNDIFVSTMPAVADAGPYETPTPRANGAGVPESALQDTLISHFNDLDHLEGVLAAHGDDVAAVIVEPLAMYGTFIEPADGYLDGVKALAAEHGAVFILDEVKTGCRIAYGGASEYYDVEPDIVTLGKAISGGVPGGAFGGREEVMRDMSYQASGRGRTEHVGTYNANPLLVTSGLVSLQELTPDVYDELGRRAERIATAVRDALADTGITARVDHAPGVGYIHFGLDRPVTDYRTASGQDFETAQDYWYAAANNGVLLAPKLAAWYLSAALTDEDVETVVEAKKAAIEAIA